MNNYKKILAIILSFIPPIIVALFYSKLPDLIPLRWSNGDIQYGDKVQIIYVTLLLFATTIFLPLCEKIDPKKEKYIYFKDLIPNIMIANNIFYILLISIIISESFNPNMIKVEQLIIFATGVLFIFIGNIMPKIKSNFFYGIRTPWTISNEEVWFKTHRLGGKVLLISGFIICLSSIFIKNINIMIVIIFITSLGSALYPTYMSYYWFNQNKA